MGPLIFSDVTDGGLVVNKGELSQSSRWVTNYTYQLNYAEEESEKESTSPHHLWNVFPFCFCFCFFHLYFPSLLPLSPTFWMFFSFLSSFYSSKVRKDERIVKHHKEEMKEINGGGGDKTLTTEAKSCCLHQTLEQARVQSNYRCLRSATGSRWPVLLGTGFKVRAQLLQSRWMIVTEKCARSTVCFCLGF